MTVFEFERQAQSERRTHAEFALSGDITAVGIHDFAHKRQPKASAGLVGVLTTGYTVEFFKYTLHILGCDSITLVCHFDQKIVSFRPHGDKYLSAGRAVLDSVGNDVCDCLSEQIRVHHYNRQILFKFALDRNAARYCNWVKQQEYALNQRLHSQRCFPQGARPGLEASNIQIFIYHPGQTFGLLVDGRVHLSASIGVYIEFREYFAEALNRRERRPQFVRDQGHDFRLHLLQFPLFRYFGERRDSPDYGVTAAVGVILANRRQTQNEMSR